MSINPEYRGNGGVGTNGNGGAHVYGAGPHDTFGPADAAADASIGTLLKELVHEVPALLRNEVALAKSEMRENLKQAAVGVGAIAAGAAIALAALVILMMALVYALSNVMAPWLAALIVAAIGLGAGYALYASGRKKLDPADLRPDRTIESLRQDKNALKGGTV